MTAPDTLTHLTAALADRYRIDRELGQGGMATVYLAEDVRHRRKVAIKVLHPELSAVIGSEAEGVGEALALDEDFPDAGFRLTPS